MLQSLVVQSFEHVIALWRVFRKHDFDSESYHISIASDMETTAEQQTTDLTDASKYSHDEASTRPCAYTQPPMDLICAKDNSPVENHNASL